MKLSEVEQKFTYALGNLTKFYRNQGTPPFRQLKSVNVDHWEEIYYDSKHKLSSTGLWVRKRSYEWQAKQKVPGSTFARSTFHETKDVSEIQEMIRKRFPECPGPEKEFGLSELCQFYSTREEYLADEKFTVILDKTSFGHTVGEVELQAEDAERAHGEIDAFMAKYAWFFDKRNPTGKLSAYFRKKGVPR